MFTINIDPVAFHIGALSVKWYGIMVALAVATLLLVSSREAKRLDISLDTLYSIFLWGILGGLIGARLVYLIDCVVTHPGQPVHIIGFAGLGLFGAILGALLAVWVYTRVTRVAWSSMAIIGDAVAVGAPLAQAIGRVGCTVNGCCYGKPTSLPWAVVYSHAGSACGLQGIPLHPTQIYMLLWNLVVFAVVWQMRRRLKERGALFILYLWLYAIGDFVIRFFRVNEVFLWGLQQGQVISLAIFVGALSLFILKIRRTTSTEQSQEA